MSKQLRFYKSYASTGTAGTGSAQECTCKTFGNTLTILFKACLFDLTFYKGSHSKGLKQRALHVHQRKTKSFTAKQ